MKKWLLILCLVCVGIHAENWKNIGGNDSAEMSIDVDSITETNGIREAWSMWNFKTARPNIEPDFPALKSYKNRHQYNCKDQTMKPTNEIIFSENNGKGTSRDHSSALKNMPFAMPMPNTVADAMLQLVCNSPPQAKGK